MSVTVNQEIVINLVSKEALMAHVIITCDVCDKKIRELWKHTETPTRFSGRVLCDNCEKIEARKCANRIQGELESLNANLKPLFELYQNGGPEGDQSDEGFNQLAEYAAGVEILKTTKLILSGGGPASWLEVTTDEEGITRKVLFVFEDWFDHAEINVKAGTQAWKFAEFMVEAH